MLEQTKRRSHVLGMSFSNLGLSGTSVAVYVVAYLAIDWVSIHMQVVLAVADQQIWQVACGNAHSVCVSVDGTLYAWGRGANGRLGHGSQSDLHAPRVVEIKALERPPSSRPKEIAAAAERSMSVGAPAASSKQSSRWGFTRGGQGGKGSGASASGGGGRSAPMIRQQIHAVACGWNFTTVVTTNGDVYCMGRGTEGQCGSQIVVDRLTPHVVETLRGKHFHVTSIACGSRHTLALCRSGDVFSWGLGDFGQLGSGAAYCPLPEMVRFPQAQRGTKSAPSSPQRSGRRNGGASGSGAHAVGAGANAGARPIDHDCVSEIACGPWHSVAVTAKGRVFTWGLNTNSQLGLGHHRDCGRPQLVRGLPPNLNVGHVTCVASATLLLERHSYQAHDETEEEDATSAQDDASAHSHEKSLEGRGRGGGGGDGGAPKDRGTKRGGRAAKPKKVDAWRDMVRPSALKYASPREQHFYNVERAALSPTTDKRSRDHSNKRQLFRAGQSGRSVSAGGKLLTHTRYSTDAFAQLTSKLWKQEVRRVQPLWRVG